MTKRPSRAGAAPRPRNATSYAIIATLAMVSLVASASTAFAQTLDSIEAGSRVRVTAPSLGLTEAVGTVQQSTTDAVQVQFEFPRRLVTVDRSDITAMDVSVGTRRSIGKGIGIGVLVGAGSGVLIGLASGDDEEGFIRFSAEEKSLVAGLGLGLVGGVVGLIAGAANRHDVWAPARVDGLGVAIRPRVSSDGVGLVVGFALPVGGRAR